jgi:1-deoxy-D-xylulose-5-phosphate synthase
MVRLGEEDDRVVAITAAMPDGTGLVEFSRRFPERFFDVGIAEQHAITLSCGLAFGGMHPVVAIYSTFMQRAADQLIHDAALQKAPIVVAMDRGGVVGEDGPTHHGVFDISMFLPVPELRFGAPRNCRLLDMMLSRAVLFQEGPTLLRYPRGEEPDLRSDAPESVEPGQGQLLREGDDVLLIGVGVMALHALAAADLLSRRGLSAAVLDPLWLKPAPESEILSLSRGKRLVAVIEEGSVSGGFGCLVSSMLPGGTRVLRMGIPDRFQPHACRSELLGSMGLDPGSIADRIGEELGS